VPALQSGEPDLILRQGKTNKQHKFHDKSPNQGQLLQQHTQLVTILREKPT
jgi:hypothetical protein